MPRKSTKPAAEASAPAVSFREADRDQYGGDMMMIESRRKPDGTYAPDTRPVNAGSMEFRKGDFVYKPNPSLPYHIITVYVDSTAPWSMAEVSERLEEGYRFCDAKDWSVRDTKQFLWKPNVTKRLSHMGQADKVLTPMWIPWALFLENQRKQTALSDDIQVSMDDRLRAARENFARDGGGAYRINSANFDVQTTKEERFVPDKVN